MASVIRFGTIDMPLSAIEIASFRSAEMNYTNGHLEPAYGVVTKNRNVFCNTVGAETTQSISYDLGTTENRTIDYLAVIRIDKLQKIPANDLDITLMSDADGAGTYTTRKQIDYTYTASRHSPRDQDYIETFASVTTDHRYWSVDIRNDGGGGASHIWQTTGFYFGELFDIGADPEDFTAKSDMRGGGLISENGSVHMAPPIYRPIEFTISWMGITDAKVEATEDLIYNANRYGILLYSTNTDLTDGYSVCHCHEMEIEVKRIWTNYNSVTIKLKEIV